MFLKWKKACVPSWGKLGQFKFQPDIILLLPTFSHQALAEIGKAKQAYGPMAPAGFQKLWAISKKYGPWQ